MNIESNKTQQPALVMPQNATPLTVADTLIRWCNDREFIEDVMYYVECYYKRQNDVHTQIISSPSNDMTPVNS